jgi:hypothetical protein
MGNGAHSAVGSSQFPTSRCRDVASRVSTGILILFRRFGWQAFARSERKAGRPAEQAAFPRRELIPVFVGIDEPVALFRRHAAHAANRPVDGLTAVGRQLFELLKELARLLLLIGRQVLPGSHAVEHALLLLRRQAGKMLQPLPQLRLLLRGKPAELWIVFERAALLRRRQILIAAEPVSGVPRLVLRRMELIGTAGAGTTFFLKAVPLPVRSFRLRMRLWRPLRLPRLRRPLRIPRLGKHGGRTQGRQQQKRR